MIMKKVLTLIIFAFVMLFPVRSAAQLQFGVKGGLNITEMKLSDEVFDSSNRNGFFIGPTLKFKVPIIGLGVDASALYDQREGKVEGENVKSKSLSIPVNARYEIGLGSLLGVFVFAGPQFDFRLGDDEIQTENIDWKLRDSNFSVNVGGGVFLASHLQLSANYNIVCGKTGDVTYKKTAEAVTKTKARNCAWQLGLTYYF